MQHLWDWIAGQPPILGVITLSLLPVSELRGAIPWGVWAAHLPLWQVVGTAIVANWLVAPLSYLFMKYVLRLMLRWRWFSRVWERYTNGLQKRVGKAMEGWGAWGLAIFIGIPLPGTGVYSGAIGAYLMGMGFRRFLWVGLVGVLMAAAIVTAVVATGSQAFSWVVNGRAMPGH